MKKRNSQGDAADEGRKSPRLYLREVASEDDGPYAGIGSDLRAARVEMGVDVTAVADNLRISRLYLEAIEDGRFDDLPGSVYVYGFLRSYAEFLDLEPKAVISKYKSETEGPKSESKLHFPSPMDRGRLPTGRLLASSLVLAGLIYAGWYIVNGDQRQSADLVSPVPERFRVADAPIGSTTQQVPAPLGAVTVESAGRPTERLVRRTGPAPALAALAPTEEPQVTAVVPETQPEEPQVAAVVPETQPEEPQVAAVTEQPAAAADPRPSAQAEPTQATRVESSGTGAAVPRDGEPPQQVDEFAGVVVADEPERRRPAQKDVTRKQTVAAPVKKSEEKIVVAAVETEPAAPRETQPVVEPVDETEPEAATPEPTSTRSVPAFLAAEERAKAAAEERKRQEAAAAAAKAEADAETKAKAEADAKAKAQAEAKAKAQAEERKRREVAAADAKAKAQAEERKRREVAAAEAKAKADAATKARAEATQRRRQEVAAARAKARAEADERRRRQAAAREQRIASRSATASNERDRSVQIEDAAAPVEVEPLRDENESVQLSAARRISELSSDGAEAGATNGAVRSFPVPPPIPQGEQTATLSRGGYVPQVFGASNGGSRVIIEAKLESWVQVRGRSGETLLTRILRVGDKYHVPDRPNLVMMTGNAGALKITVDGDEIGVLGPPGAVLRDVSLEPSQLLARVSAQ